MSTSYQPDADRVWRREGSTSIAFSDGDEVEERLYRVVSGAAQLGTFSTELRAAITDWSSEYHLSRARHCLLRPLGIKAGDAVLEIGCGCGALTRYLGECGANVVGVEGSVARARIAAARCRDLPNVRIFCDNFLEFKSNVQFDWVVLVGVLEYAPLFSDSLRPMEHYLATAQQFLAPGGSLVLAIENQLGLKYFNGCAEDHVGVPFFGLENLYGPSSPATCGKLELERRLRSCGFAELEWHYPFPDYKLPSVIVAANAFHAASFNVADLLVRAQSRDYSGQSARVFDEALVYPVLEQNGLIEHMSNSLMVIAHKGGRHAGRDLVYLAWTYAIHRQEEFAVETTFASHEERVTVEKTLLSPWPAEDGQRPAREVTHTPQASVYRQGRLSIWRVLEATARNASTPEMAAAFLPWFDELLRRAHISANPEPAIVTADAHLSDYMLDPGLIDCTPFNLVEHPGGFFIIDQEWQWSEPISLGQVVCRGILHSLAVPLSRGATHELSEIVKALCAMRRLSVDVAEIHAWLRLEQEFLAAVGAPVPNLLELMGCRGQLLGIYPELVRRIQEVCALQSKITCMERAGATRDTVMQRRIAESETARAGLVADIHGHVRQIAALEQLLSSQTVVLAAITRDLSEQSVLHESTKREETIAISGAPPLVGATLLAAELETAKTLLEEAIGERNAARERASMLQQACDGLLASSSWRITAPLRALKARTKSITTRLRHPSVSVMPR